MTKLAQLQTNFIHDCLSGPLTADNTLMANDLDTQLISAQGLMGIYQHSAIANITNSLSLSYPVIERLVGKDFFQIMCKPYIVKHWPNSGNMDDYGKYFSSFLAEFEQVKHLSYLEDVAQLEWLFHQSSLANDNSFFDWTSLAKVVSSETLTFLLSPSVSIMRSTMPVDKIWLMNQVNAPENVELSLDGDSDTFIVLFRQELKTEMMTLIESEFTFLQSIENGLNFATAIESAKAVDDSISIDHCLKKYIELGVISGFSI
jgi:Putative DNA-binding domain